MRNNLSPPKKKITQNPLLIIREQKCPENQLQTLTMENVIRGDETPRNLLLPKKEKKRKKSTPEELQQAD